MLTSDVRFFDALLDLKQTSASGDTVAFEGWRNGKADGFVSPAFIRDNKVSVQRIQATLPALNGGIEALEIDCNLSALFQLLCLLFITASVRQTGIDRLDLQDYCYMYNKTCHKQYG